MEKAPFPQPLPAPVAERTVARSSVSQPPPPRYSLPPGALWLAFPLHTGARTVAEERSPALYSTPRVGVHLAPAGTDKMASPLLSASQIPGGTHMGLQALCVVSIAHSPWAAL